VRKSEYLRDLARHFVDGTIRAQRWPEMDDEAVIAELVEVRGIGRWTAEMFLMFSLLRPNVLPVDDLGLRRAASLHYFDGEAVGAADGRPGGRWRPGISGAASTRCRWNTRDRPPVVLSGGLPRWSTLVV
jgi:DNA-3-methyladenine glycosylase II